MKVYILLAQDLVANKTKVISIHKTMNGAKDGRNILSEYDSNNGYGYYLTTDKKEDVIYLWIESSQYDETFDETYTKPIKRYYIVERDLLS